MFIGERVIYLELHKTACSHVLKLLEAIPSLQGKIIGKHNPLLSVPAYELGDITRKVKIGTVRNPWDWYVSLWAFGCQGKGGLHGQVTKPYSFGRKIKNLLLRGTSNKHVEEWKSVYHDANNVELFRRWLKMLFTPKYKFDVGEGYGFAPLSNFAGLLMYRYLVLFTKEYVREKVTVRTPEQLKDYAEEKTLLDCVIRSENLVEDFRGAMKRVPVPVEEVEGALEKITGRTNASERGPYRQYYDGETRELVAARDGYIIQKFGYEF